MDMIHPDFLSYAIGIDLGGTKVKLALVNSEGLPIQTEYFLSQSLKHPSAMIDKIAGLANHLAKLSPTPPLGIGVGMAGQVDFSGNVIFAPNLGWREVPLQQQLRDLTDLPVIVINDVRAGAIGEWLFGHGKGCSSMLCIFLGTGIGGGIISEGHLLIGSNNSAGEIGHMVVELNGPPCTCGGRGCLEAIASGWAIAKQAQEAAASDTVAAATLMKLVHGQINLISAKQVVQAAQEGDPFSQQLLNKAREAFSIGMVGLVNIFNPNVLVLGGGLFEAQHDLLDQVKEKIDQYALPSARHVSVVPTLLGSNVGVIGAAASFFQNPQTN